MLKNILDNKESYQPGLSIDCVIFGFHDNQLKVLLIKTKYSDRWALPGGFVSINEDIDQAAVTVLYGRTGLKGIFLRQFSTFGTAKRCNVDVSNAILDFYGIPLEEGKWFASRFVTVVRSANTSS